MASRPSNSMGRAPGGGEEGGEAYQGLEWKGRAPGEEIEAAAPAGGRCSGGGGAAQVEKGGGVARGVEEVLLPFYRAEGEVERAR
jgi:hypothetical protein